jgi:hypothetical protein
MSRLFLTKREINFINDIAKEIVKDVVGQKVYYFPISEIKSKVHDVYEESPEKIFENPIALDAIVKYSPQTTKTDKFGSEKIYNIEVHVQSKDLIDKQIEILEGDFISFGETFYEILTSPDETILFGQIEHSGYKKISARQTRKGQFLAKVFGPTSEKYSDEDAVQENFYQQRGFYENSEGVTGDVRELRKNGTLDDPITGPKKVTKSANGSKFYDDE